MMIRISWIKYSFAAILIIVLIGCSSKQPNQMDGEKVRAYANALYNRELYPQAIAEYEKYLVQYPVQEEQQANIIFIMGNIYFERLHEYDNALAEYLKIKHLFPNSHLQAQVDKQVVACLERLHRSTDAKQALDESTFLDKNQVEASRPGKVLAKMGDREITAGDLQHHISQMPDYIQQQMKSKEAKAEFLKQYVATELFYDAAKRQQLDQDKDVVEGTFQAQKSLMVQKYLEQEIAPQVQITPDDVQLYYDAHKDQYAEKDDKGNVTRQKPLQEVQNQVAQDLGTERQQKVLDALLKRMMATENVEIYTDLVQ